MTKVIRMGGQDPSGNARGVSVDETGSVKTAIDSNVIIIAESINQSINAGATTQIYNQDIKASKVVVKIRAENVHEFELRMTDTVYMFQNVLNEDNPLVEYYFEQAGNRKVIVFPSIGTKFRLLVRNTSAVAQNYEIQIVGIL